VVSDSPEADEILPVRRNMLGHARVLERCMDHGSVLPARFGHLLPGRDALTGCLGPHQQAVLSALERFDRRAEFGVRIRGCRDAAMQAIVAEDPAIGTLARNLGQRGPDAYYDRIAFGRKVGDLLAARRKRAQTALLARLRPLAENHALHAPEDDMELLRADFLLPRGREQDFADAIEAAGRTLDFAPGVAPTVRLVGPAPVFNFISLRLDPGATLLTERAAG
jgi:hypothetical protein